MGRCRSVRSGSAPARAEMNYASTRITALKLSEVLEPSDRAPGTYAEFLHRTSLLIPGVSLPGPPARCR
jgi:hypothetical protein